MKHINEYDVLVVGGGHAGIEAAAAPANLGLTVGLVSMDRHKIGLMSCNPAIGGLAKGQLVREIDALGGVMAQITDATGIHFKMLNKSKGPAVWSPRAQADRQEYADTAQACLAGIKNLHLIEAMANGLIVSKGRATGIKLQDGRRLAAKTLILTTGTFLNGVIHIGLQNFRSGRAGEKPATGISEELIKLGFQCSRLKTGTPPRLHRDSIDFSKFETQHPDDPAAPFSFSTDIIRRRQIPCFIGYTNAVTHDILRQGFGESPMFTGRIKSAGPRYCPSIEDKIDRFADRTRHQLFLEPEGYESQEIYINGFSTSLPEHIQRRAIHSIQGLEKSEIVRLGYAVEYDFFPPNQLRYTLETKKVKNLFFAGQINGTSGYEEAAAQGLIAGINAAMNVSGGEPFRLKRSEAYIGVLIDDLINKSTLEPYRMFTSRAEFRLLLRQDNADLRLSHHAERLGLLPAAAYGRVEKKKEEIDRLNRFIRRRKIPLQKFNDQFGVISSEIRQDQLLYTLAKRPELSLENLITACSDEVFSPDALREVAFNTKYEGYVKRSRDLINRFHQYENKKFPSGFDFNGIKSLSTEAREKLKLVSPESFGQASRISGVTPADLSVLLIYLEREKYRGSVSRETSIED